MIQVPGKDIRDFNFRNSYIEENSSFDFIERLRTVTFLKILDHKETQNLAG